MTLAVADVGASVATLKKYFQKKRACERLIKYGSTVRLRRDEMPNTSDVDRSLLYLRLDSFLSAHWDLRSLLRPRAPAHHSPAHLDPSHPELADYVWITFAGERDPRAVGIRVHRRVPGAPRYEIVEWSRPGELSCSLWRYRRSGGWQQLNVPGFPHDAVLQGC